MSPQWAKTAIWWSVYPLGACGAPIREPDSPGVHHRLGRLEAWLDDVLALGCNGVALGPIWASSTHGYDVIDHARIDPRLGDDADFDRLVAACRVRGIRVLLDGVFNHVSVDHAAVRAAGAGQAVAATILRSDERSVDGLSRFEGHAGLVELDHSKSAVAEYVVSVMNQWLARGADGWRLDAAYRVPSAFWAAVLPRVRAAYPEALIVAEVLHGDYAGIAEAAGFDSVTQYELWKAIWSSLKDRNPHELAWALARHERLAGRVIPWTFVGNHDVTRIATQVGVAAARVATGLLMTLPGMSAVYYGDERGLTGLKRECLGGDDEIRPALPDEPGPWSGDAAETLRLTQLAIGWRRRHPWLVDGHITIREPSQGSLQWRTAGGSGAWLQADLDCRGEQPRLVVTDDRGERLAW